MSIIEAADEAVLKQQIMKKGDETEMLRMSVTGMLILLLGGTLLLLTPQPTLAAGGPAPLNVSARFLPSEGGDLVLLRDLAGKLGWGLEYLPREKAVIVKNRGKEERLAVSDGNPPDSKGLDGEGGETAPRIVDGRTWIDLEAAGALVRDLNPELSVLLTGLYSLKDRYRQGEEVTVRIRAFNLSPEVLKLDFSSGQRYDLYLTREGREVWRWSEGRFFTMALARVELEPGEELSYEVKVPTAELKPGLYTVGGELSTLNPCKLNEAELWIL